VDQDPAALLATQNLVIGSRGECPQLGRVDLELTARAATCSQLRCAHTSMAGADLVIESQQVVGYQRRDLSSLLAQPLHLGLECGELPITVSDCLPKVCLDPRRTSP
jgi:hypothetical protein